jgi:hypothetical protein
MQDPVHNRATIRVADTAEVSGRVTADEVNLDRFHNRIRKVYASVAATSKVYLSAATMILIVALAVPAVAQITFGGAIQGHEIDTILQGKTQSAFGTATGIVSNLGQLSLTYELAIDLTSGMGMGSGQLLIAKNGDIIFANIKGQFHLPTAPLSVPSVTEMYTVTGGTGRFVGATGHFTVERLVELETGFSFTGGVIHDGTIIFPKAENAQ